MYIALIFVSTLLFSIQFLFGGVYSKNEGSALQKSMLLAILCSAASAVLLLFTTAEWSFTWFSLLCAFLSAAANVAMTYCSVRVLSIGDLSIYTRFSMIGGMLIPSMAGILLYGEPLTWQKAVCTVWLIAATVIGRPKSEKSGTEKKSGAIKWYLAVFFLNGIWGMFAKVHQSAPEMAVSGSMFTLMIRLLVIAISFAMLTPMMMRGEKIALAKPKMSTGCAVGYGLLNTAGNLILLEALLHVDASMQYPIVTGGVMILTVIIDRMMGKRPSRRTLIATALAFIGLTVLAL